MEQFIHNIYTHTNAVGFFFVILFLIVLALISLSISIYIIYGCYIVFIEPLFCNKTVGRFDTPRPPNTPRPPRKRLSKKTDTNILNTSIMNNNSDIELRKICLDLFSKTQDLTILHFVNELYIYIKNTNNEADRDLKIYCTRQILKPNVRISIDHISELYKYLKKSKNKEDLELKKFCIERIIFSGCIFSKEDLINNLKSAVRYVRLGTLPNKYII